MTTRQTGEGDLGAVMSYEPFTMPHWRDPVVQAVALAVYDDASLHSALTFQREEAVTFWPGIDARRFVAMMRAYGKATTTSSVGTQSRSDGVNT